MSVRSASGKVSLSVQAELEHLLDDGTSTAKIDVAQLISHSLTDGVQDQEFNRAVEIKFELATLGIRTIECGPSFAEDIGAGAGKDGLGLDWDVLEVVGVCIMVTDGDAGAALSVTGGGWIGSHVGANTIPIGGWIMKFCPYDGWDFSGGEQITLTATGGGGVSGTMVLFGRDDLDDSSSSSSNSSTSTSPSASSSTSSTSSQSFSSSSTSSSTSSAQGIGDEYLWYCASRDHWGFQTANVTDLSGNDFPSELHSNMDPATSWVADTGEGGSVAWDFDGTNDRMDTAFDERLNFDEDTFSVSFWMKADATLGTNTAGYRVIDKRGTGAAGTVAGWDIRAYLKGGNVSLAAICDGGNADEYVRIGDGLEFEEIDTGVAAGTWLHVVMVWRPQDNRWFWFVNGNVVRQHMVGDYNVGHMNNMVGLNIGGEYNAMPPTQPFKGRLDDIRIFRRDLSSAEIIYLAAQRCHDPTLESSTSSSKSSQSDDNSSSTSSTSSTSSSSMGLGL